MGQKNNENITKMTFLWRSQWKCWQGKEKIWTTSPSEKKNPGIDQNNVSFVWISLMTHSLAESDWHDSLTEVLFRNEREQPLLLLYFLACETQKSVVTDWLFMWLCGVTPLPNLSAPLDLYQSIHKDSRPPFIYLASYPQDTFFSLFNIYVDLSLTFSRR